MPPDTGETQPIIRIVEVLPAPFGPEEAERLAGRDVEVDAVDRGELAEPLRQPAGMDERGGRVGGRGPGARAPPPRAVRTWTGMVLASRGGLASTNSGTMAHRRAACTDMAATRAVAVAGGDDHVPARSSSPAGDRRRIDRVARADRRPLRRASRWTRRRSIRRRRRSSTRRANASATRSSATWRSPIRRSSMSRARSSATGSSCSSRRRATWSGSGTTTPMATCCGATSGSGSPATSQPGDRSLCRLGRAQLGRPRPGGAGRGRVRDDQDHRSADPHLRGRRRHRSSSTRAGS